MRRFSLADAVVGLTNPLRERLADLQANEKQVKEQVMASSTEIRKRAQQTLLEVREIVGLT